MRPEVAVCTSIASANVSDDSASLDGNDGLRWRNGRACAFFPVVAYLGSRVQEALKIVFGTEALYLALACIGISSVYFGSGAKRRFGLHV